MNPTIMATVLQYKPNLEARSLGLTPLFQAVSTGSAETVQLLLNAGADINARTTCKIGTGESVLHMATASWKESLIPLLIQQGADVNVSGTNPAGQTALHVAVSQGNGEAARELIKAGADVHARYTDGKTALHIAAREGLLDIALILLDQGSDAMAECKRGMTPILTAALHKQDKMLRCLFDSCSGAMSQEWITDTASMAIGLNAVNLLKLFYENGLQVRFLSREGDTSLAFAAAFGGVETLKFYLEIGEDPRQRNDHNETALDVAIREGHKDAMKLLQLAEQGDNVDFATDLPQSPVHTNQIQSRGLPEFSPSNIAHSMATVMALQRKRNIRANPEPPGRFNCNICRDLDFRRGMQSDTEVIHILSIIQMNSSVTSGCRSCRFLSECLQKVEKIYGENFQRAQIDSLVLYSMAFGSPLLLCTSVMGSRSVGDIEIYLNEGFHATWPAVGFGRDVSLSNAWPEERAQHAKKLLRDCTETHRFCQYRKGSLPSRVLWVGSASEEPYLYTSRGEHADYIALSHCWGGVAPITTTVATIQRRMQAIPYQGLPETFKDAVIVTRSLGVDYLWIDSLCIIQDSREDWKRESAAMKDIYKNCYAMIAADDSTNVNGGCFTATGGISHDDCVVESTGPYLSKARVGVRVTHPRDAYHMKVCHEIGHLHLTPQTSRSPLDRRGWSLQERVLAPRIIHFGQSEFGWECSEMVTCECQSITTKWDKESRFKALLADNSLRQAVSKSPDRVKGPDLLLWTHFVQEFTQRQLSHDSDMLHALTGLASYMAEVTKAEYICGIWKQELAEFLLWTVEHQSGTTNKAATLPTSPAPFKQLQTQFETPTPVRSRRHESYYAPSWSWASVIGHISFSVGPFDGAGEDRYENMVVSKIRKDGLVKRNERRVSLLELVEAECTTDPSNLFGPPLTASLTVCGYIVPVTKVGKEKAESLGFKDGETLISLLPGSPSVAPLATSLIADVLDEYSNISAGDSLLLLFVIRIRGGDVPEGDDREEGGKSKLKGLVLTPVTSNPLGDQLAEQPVYSRIGMFGTSGVGWQQAATKTTLTII